MVRPRCGSTTWKTNPLPGDSHSFTDVTDAAQDDAISWMANNEITTGTSPTTFAPDDTLTRAQAATFLHRLEGEPDAPAHNFVDVVAAWQQGGVSWMAHTGITTGTSPTTFAPDDTLTRAHLVTFLYRYQNEPEVTINTTSPNCDAEPDPTPQGAFTAITAGSGHSCGLRSNGTAQCWGYNSNGQTDAPTGTFTAITTGSGPFVWAQNRRHRPMLGLQQQRCKQMRLHRYVHRDRSRLGSIRVGSEPTAPPNAGAPTSSVSVQPMRPQARSPPSQPAGAIRVGSEATAPPNAGASTATVKQMRPQVRSPPHSRLGPFVWAQNRRHRPMLELQPLRFRYNRCAHRHVHRHHSRLATIRVGSEPTAPPNAGATTATVKQMRPQAHSPPSQPARAIRVGSEPTAPPNAGATTAPVKRMRPQARSPPSQPARAIRVGSEPTAPPNAGVPTAPVERMRPQARSPPSQPARRHSCGLRTDGTAQCWGDNGSGQTDAPPGAFTAITAGEGHSCGLRSDGTAQCWGDNGVRSNRCAPRRVHRHHNRQGAFVWAQKRRHRPMLG